MKTPGISCRLLSLFSVLYLISTLGCLTVELNKEALIESALTGAAGMAAESIATAAEPLERIKKSYQKGSKLQGEGRHEKAIQEFEKALNLNQKIQDKAAKDYNTRNQKEEAGEFIANKVQPALKISQSKVAYDEAVALEEQGLISEAIAKYKSAIQIKPNHTSANQNLNRLLAQASFERGQKYEADGNLEDAITQYESALEFEPDHSQSQIALKSVSAELGKIKAEEAYQLGQKYEADGKLEQAISQYESALEFHSDHSQSQIALKSVSAKLKELEEIRVAAEFKRIRAAAAETLAKNQKKAQDAYERGQKYEADGKLEQAISQYESALEFHSDHSQSQIALKECRNKADNKAKKSSDLFQKGKAAILNKEFETAEEYLQEAQQLNQAVSQSDQTKYWIIVASYLNNIGKESKGNLLIKKFYLGMKITDALALLKTIYADVVGDINQVNELAITSDGILQTGVLHENHIFDYEKHIPVLWIRADEKGKVTKILFSRNEVDYLFKTKGIEAQDFAQRFYNNVLAVDDIKNAAKSVVTNPFAFGQTQDFDVWYGAIDPLWENVVGSQSGWVYTNSSGAKVILTSDKDLLIEKVASVAEVDFD